MSKTQKDECRIKRFRMVNNNQCLIDGTLLNVKDSKKPLLLKLIAKDQKPNKGCDPERCSVATGGRRLYGGFWFVMKTVTLWVPEGSDTAYRYINHGGSDADIKAASLVIGNHDTDFRLPAKGITIRLSKPSGTNQLGFWRTKRGKEIMAKHKAKDKRLRAAGLKTRTRPYHVTVSATRRFEIVDRAAL